MTTLIVTGTGTGVGKTMVTAALASRARGAGIEVAVCKPVQTGYGADGDGDDDLAEIRRLSGAQRLVGLARYPEPLAPAAAADLAGTSLPSATEIIAAVRAVDAPGRLTLVEGAGGLLVEIASGGATLRDLAVDLGATVLVVCGAGLGTLNHTALTVEAIAVKGLSCSGLVIGAWPAEPGAAERYNRGALARLAPMRGMLPAGAAALAADDFAAMSRQAFDAAWFAGLVS